MVIEAERLTELELRYMQQSDLVDTLNQELVSAQERVDVLEKRVQRLENQMESLLHLVDERPNERPPHY